MLELDLDAIEQRTTAASPGPWEWCGDARFHTIELSNWLPGFGRCAILRPRRAGMQSATFEFAVQDWRMKRAEELAVYEVAPEATSADDPRVYRHDIIGIRHPDAEFIAHARDDVPALLAEVRKLRARISDAVAEWDASKYGDPEAPFRMRAHIDRDHLGTDFNVSETNVPLREETPHA